MAQQPRTRQELYERIRESSKDEVILEEMMRLGFWPKTENMPENPADDIRRLGALESKLRELRTQHSRLTDLNALRKEVQKKRMEASKERRKEAKERRIRERKERAAAWKEHKKSHINYLGDGVSGGLGDVQSDIARLAANGLEPIHNAAELAEAMETSVGELRFLAFTRAAAKISQYVQFTVPKKSGGTRLISAPQPRLKGVQYWILDFILGKQNPHAAAHGFAANRSIITNATPHVGSDVVINLDLKDFFPTITYKRVKGLFRWMGYSESVATILGLLCTEPRRQQIDLDGETYHVADDERVLPQGAPTSPAISNLICRNLDSRIEHTCEELGFVYTRYADDMSFSADKNANVGRLLRRVRFIIDKEGFVVHPDKTRVLRRSGRQEVTGIVVNEFPNVERKILRRFRATLFQVEKDGPEGKRWGSGGDVIASLDGFASFVMMVNEEKGSPLHERTQALIRKYQAGWQGKIPQRWRPKPRPPAIEIEEAPESVQVSEPTTQRNGAASPSTDSRSRPRRVVEKKKSWWKFWR